MFGFGSISSFFLGDDYNPVEPFSGDEFVTHSDRELQNLDADHIPYNIPQTPMVVAVAAGNGLHHGR